MNNAYTRARLAQVDRKIHEMEEELRVLKKERIRLKTESSTERTQT